MPLALIGGPLDGWVETGSSPEIDNLPTTIWPSAYRRSERIDGYSYQSLVPDKFDGPVGRCFGRYERVAPGRYQHAGRR
jgi:hypothetical protein